MPLVKEIQNLNHLIWQCYRKQPLLMFKFVLRMHKGFFLKFFFVVSHSFKKENRDTLQNDTLSHHNELEMME